MMAEGAVGEDTAEAEVKSGGLYPDQIDDIQQARARALTPRRIWSIKARLRVARLPNQGRIRYVPPKGYNPASRLPRGPSNGYIDRFGNNWVKGPSRTAGDPFEWDVQLSRTGRAQLGWLSGRSGYLNVSPGGQITHVGG